MKIAVPADAPDLDAQVENKLGTAAYLLIIDLEDMAVEAVEGPPLSHGPGAGIEALSTVIGLGVEGVLTGYISPRIAGALRQNGIEVVTSVSGSVRDAVEKYRQDRFSPIKRAESGSATGGAPFSGGKGHEALRMAVKQFSGMFPVLAGVVLLVGLFQALLPRTFLMALFSGRPVRDTVWGACVGSIFTGNPMASYVIGETLVKMDASLFGVTALMLSWVSVGIVQLPAEISALGARFAVIRNTAAFLIVIPSAMLIAWLAGGSP
jgi:predicted Fe-Mo cluster-binding NifX family protein